LQIKAVLFDLFDTLILIENGEAFYEPSLLKLHEFLVKMGVDSSFEDFKRAYFDARDNLYEDTFKNLEEPHFNVRVSKALQNLGYDFSFSDPVVCGATFAFCEEFMRYVRLDKDAQEVLRKLCEKYKLGIVSNFALPECVWKLLDKFGLRGFFDIVVISGAINRRKPSPKIFEKALESIGFSAPETVFVGDTLDVDIKGAKEVGMKTILVERKSARRIGSICPDKIVKSLKELVTVLETC
jgi:HAD superfamily hydrolase (TIGR01549 family)